MCTVVIQTFLETTDSGVTGGRGGAIAPGDTLQGDARMK